MPWKELLVSDQRMRFVLACLGAEESLASLCRKYGVSRRTGYKWLARYREQGPPGLSDRSRAPRCHPNQIEEKIERRILSLRADHPSWGARKLLASLTRQCEEAGESIDWPAAGTVGQMLRRAGLIVRSRRRRRQSMWSPPRGAAPGSSCASGGPNRLWCADFKGWFRTLDGARCDPLTITDAHSRYLLRCRVVPRLTCTEARGHFEATFQEFGLPDAIRTDNGSPFASTGLAGLSQLSAWWVRLGITHQRIDPGCPQQNGSHERMHGTLKKETASPPAPTLRAQQKRFDAFIREYNQERPHEGLAGMATPASLYVPSSQVMPPRLPELEYPPQWQRRHVDVTGKFWWDGRQLFLSHALEKQTIGLCAWGDDEPTDGPVPVESKRYWQMYFGPVELGMFDAKRERMLSVRERRHLAG